MTVRNQVSFSCLWSNSKSSQPLEVVGSLRQKLANYDPWAKSGPSPVFINNILLALISSFTSIYCLQPPSCYNGRLQELGRDCTTHGLKIFPLCPFLEIVCRPQAQAMGSSPSVLVSESLPSHSCTARDFFKPQCKMGQHSSHLMGRLQD